MKRRSFRIRTPHVSRITNIVTSASQPIYTRRPPIAGCSGSTVINLISLNEIRFTFHERRIWNSRKGGWMRPPRLDHLCPSSHPSNHGVALFCGSFLFSCSVEAPMPRSSLRWSWSISGPSSANPRRRNRLSLETQRLQWQHHRNNLNRTGHFSPQVKQQLHRHRLPPPPRRRPLR